MKMLGCKVISVLISIGFTVGLLAGCNRGNPTFSYAYRAPPPVYPTSPAIPSTHQVTPAPTTDEVSDLLEVYFLDLGQGDAEIIRLNGDTMLIDAGTVASTDTLLADIRNLGISSFDYVVGTNTNVDYIGGMAAVITQFNVGRVLLPNLASPTKTYQEILDAVASKNLPVYHPVAENYFYMGQITFAIMSPNSQPSQDSTNKSTVIRMDYGKSNFLFTSDMGSDSYAVLQAEGYNVGVDVLKVGDHGSSTSLSDQMLERVYAKYAVIEVGHGNPDGDPSKLALDKLRASGVTVYRTDLNGTVEITYNGSNYVVIPSKSTANPVNTTDASPIATK